MQQPNHHSFEFTDTAGKTCCMLTSRNDAILLCLRHSLLPHFGEKESSIRIHLCKFRKKDRANGMCASDVRPDRIGHCDIPQAEMQTFLTDLEVAKGWSNAHALRLIHRKMMTPIAKL